MFTGIITAIGRIVLIDALGNENKGDEYGKRLTIEVLSKEVLPHQNLSQLGGKNYLQDVVLGDSIALNGACMTVTTLDVQKNRFTVDVSQESFSKTCGLNTLSEVNLEKALRANDRLGGHLVSGHVDGVGTISHFAQVGESWLLRIIAPASLAQYMAYKGSITVNGVSLTVNRVQDLPKAQSPQGKAVNVEDEGREENSPNERCGTCEISINLIPHTLQNTCLGKLGKGSLVNLEVDLIARYVARMLLRPVSG